MHVSKNLCNLDYLIVGKWVENIWKKNWPKEISCLISSKKYIKWKIVEDGREIYIANKFDIKLKNINSNGEECSNNQEMFFLCVFYLRIL